VWGGEEGESAADFPAGDLRPDLRLEISSRPTTVPTVTPVTPPSLPPAPSSPRPPGDRRDGDCSLSKTDPGPPRPREVTANRFCRPLRTGVHAIRG